MHHTTASLSILLLFLTQTIVLVKGSHFRGGIITWRTLNTVPSGSTVQVLVHQRYSWRRSFWPSNLCTDTMIANQGYIATGTGTLQCFTGGSCGSFTTISTDVRCTDYSAPPMDYSSGERYDTLTLPIGGTFIVGFYNGGWLALAIGGNGNWQVTSKIQLSVRPDGVLNTSPVTSTLPVIYRTINTQHVHVIQMSDADTTDTLRCRWATNNASPNQNSNNYDECNSVCAPSLPSYTLFPNNCTLVFTITTTNYYAVAVQIEDYYTSSSTTPMSSVPLQFLFYGYIAPVGCSTAPTIIGVRPNLACIGTPIGILANETVIAQVGCPGKSINQFTTSSPIGLIKTSIINPSTGIYQISLLFTPTASQYGPQGFCAAAVDNTDVQSDPWCITFLVGFTAPNLQKPSLVQGSASPIGTVFANQSIFSIQSENGMAVNRPGHNGTYIQFHDATAGGAVVVQYDCGWSPNVIYSSDTIIIYAPYAWIPGHTYYITFDSGASSGNDFCHAESAPLTDTDFWVFDIWNPDLSSTTTTTNTPPTTVTVTTRPISSTTPIANLTTTGIVITTTSIVSTTTTTATTTTSSISETTTSVTITSATPLITDMFLMTPKEFEDACRQPVLIGTIVTMMAMVPVNMLGMYAWFIKLNQMFNPTHLATRERQRRFINRISPKQPPNRYKK